MPRWLAYRGIAAAQLDREIVANVRGFAPTTAASNLVDYFQVCCLRHRFVADFVSGLAVVVVYSLIRFPRMSKHADRPGSLNQASAEFEIASEGPRAAATGRGATAPPRLSVSHLLLWTACCAAFLGAARLLAQRPAGLIGAALLMAMAIGAGTSWAGLAITLTRALRGRRWPIEPGQWLLAALGVMRAAELFALLGARVGLRNQQGVVLAISACAFVLPTLSRRTEPRWKWFFAAASIIHASPLLVSVLAAQVDLPLSVMRAAGALSSRRLAAVLAVGAVVLCAVDPGRKSRGWLHWAGIGASVWLAALSLLA